MQQRVALQNENFAKWTIPQIRTTLTKNIKKEILQSQDKIYSLENRVRRNCSLLDLDQIDYLWVWKFLKMDESCNYILLLSYSFFNKKPQDKETVTCHAQLVSTGCIRSGPQIAVDQCGGNITVSLRDKLTIDYKS